MRIASRRPSAGHNLPGCYRCRRAVAEGLCRSRIIFEGAGVILHSSFVLLQRPNPEPFANKSMCSILGGHLFPGLAYILQPWTANLGLSQSANFIGSRQMPKKCLPIRSAAAARTERRSNIAPCNRTCGRIAACKAKNCVFHAGAAVRKAPVRGRASAVGRHGMSGLIPAALCSVEQSRAITLNFARAIEFLVRATTKPRSLITSPPLQRWLASHGGGSAIPR